MKGLICYYSGTGNTKLACGYIASGVKNCTWTMHDLVKDGVPDIGGYDIVGFAAWADFFGAPKIMKNYIGQLNGKGKSAFVFNTYGNLNGRTLVMLKSLVAGSGFKVVAHHALHTPENVPILIMAGMTREDAPYPAEMVKFNDFIGKLDAWCAEFNRTGKPGTNINRSSISDFFKISFPRTLSKYFMGKKFVDKETCTKCGLCEKVCPYKAIKLDDYPVFDERKCNGCWACYNRCPQKSIYTKKYKGVGHYQSPNDKVREKLKTEK